MQPHWEEFLRLFSGLVYLIKKMDRNGFAVSFTSSPVQQKFHTTTNALRLLRSKVPIGTPNISLRLGQILKGYQDKVENYHAAQQRYLKSKWSRKPKPPRPLGIYVLTDRAWNLQWDMETPIRSLAKQLTEAQMTRRQCGIQFIQFETDALGPSQLQHLNNQLKLSV
jgi:hypothetical protein